MKIFISTFIVYVIAFSCLSPLAAQTADEYSLKGVELSDKKQYDKALEMFRKAASLQDGQSAKAFHNRGWLMELQGNIPAALENYQEAVRRNPNLSDSYERMGFWYYKAGKYADAVLMGEKVVKIDPENEEVKKWLPDAYKQRMEHPQQAESVAANQKPSPTAAEKTEVKKKDDEIVKAGTKTEEKKEEPPPVFFVSLSSVVRLGYKYRTSGVKYYETEGVIADVPYQAEIWFKPIPKSDTRFSFLAENPYLGAGIPQTVNQREKMEGVFSFGPFGLGCGFLLSHYHNDITYEKKRTVIDFKPGVIIEFKDKESAFSLSVYPKEIPYFRTTRASTGMTMDACNAQMKYMYFLDESISYYSRLASEDFYFYDNEAVTSDYWGYYDIAVGMSISSKGAAFGKDMTTSVEIGKRVYLQDLDNDKPYSRLNGQGYLGISKKKKNGRYFPGYRGMSSLFTFTTEESLSRSLFLSQKLMMEFVGKHDDHYEFALQLGVGGRF